MSLSANKPGASVSDARGQRLLSALQQMIVEGQVIVSISALVRLAQVTRAMGVIAMDDWQKRGWLAPIGVIHGEHQYEVRGQCPGAPGPAALDALGALQFTSRTDYEFDRLTYGYGTALAYQGLSELVQSEIYIFQVVPAVRSPIVADNMPFRRSTKTPRASTPWKDRPVYFMRRTPTMLLPYQRMRVAYQGAQVPCTTPVKTLIDCWVRPDLAGGADRVDDAWARYVGPLQVMVDGGEKLTNEIAAILRDSAWPAMREAFVSWFRAAYPAMPLETM